MHHNKKIKWIVLGLSVALFISAILLSVCILFNEAIVSSRWDRQGIATFFSIFDYPLKLIAASFAVFVAWITLLRVDQTADQLSILDDNNRFNNYYKHIEEFHKFLSASPVFEELVKSSQLDMKIYSKELHKYYYANSYESFRPTIRQEAITEITKYFAVLNGLQISKHNFELVKLSLEDLNKCYEAVDPKIKNMLDPLIKHLSPIDELGLSIDLLPEETQNYIKRWPTLNLLYWTEFTYRFLFVFQGIKSPTSEYFEENYQLFNTQFAKHLETQKSSTKRNLTRRSS